MMLGGWGGNRNTGRKWWWPTARFMASVTCGLTAEDRPGSPPEPYAHFLYGTTLPLVSIVSCMEPDGY